MIRVYIWRYKDLNDVGHASLEVIRDSESLAYLSWWPEETTTLFSSKCGEMVESYDVDKKRERGRDADVTFDFTKLDEENILSFIWGVASGKLSTSSLAATNTFQILVQNCSATVAHALYYGGASKYAQWPGHLIWNPNYVEFYCVDIKNESGSSAKRRLMSIANQLGHSTAPLIRSKL